MITHARGGKEAGPTSKRARCAPDLAGLRKELIKRGAQINCRMPVRDLVNHLFSCGLVTRDVFPDDKLWKRNGEPVTDLSWCRASALGWTVVCACCRAPCWGMKSEGRHDGTLRSGMLD